MEIEYKGGNTVIVSTKNTTAVFDAGREAIGQKDVAVKDNVELATEARFLAKVNDAKLRIESPGEYEVGDFLIKGIAAKRHIDAEGTLDTVYRLEAPEFRVAVLGNIDPKLSEDQLEQIGVVDILVLPVGGGGLTLDATSAVQIVRQIEPSVVIPVHYADDGVTYEMPQSELEVFTKELGAEVAESTNKLKFKAASAVPAQLTVMPIARS